MTKIDIMDLSGKILDEIKTTLATVDPEQLGQLQDDIFNAKRIYVAGAGRSLLMIRGFSMRLMQLGFESYVVGETVTPAISADDLLLIGSGSGNTETLCVIAQKAKKIGSRIGLITIFPNSTIGKMADTIVKITTSTSKTDAETGRKSIQPGGSTFEQSLLLLEDILVISISERLKLTDINKELMARHANLE